MHVSPKPVSRDILEALLAARDASHRGHRDQAMLRLAFARGGHRRSEIMALNVATVGLEDFAARRLVWIRPLETKTTKMDWAPRLPMKGRTALALLHGLEVTKITDGPLFRPNFRSDRPLSRRRASDALRTTLRHRLVLEGLPVGFATPHGLRAECLIQAALDGAPLAAAIRLSPHRSAVQVQRHDADLRIAENAAPDLPRD